MSAYPAFDEKRRQAIKTSVTGRSFIDKISAPPQFLLTKTVLMLTAALILASASCDNVNNGKVITSSTFSVTDVKLNKTSTAMLVRATETLTATVEPSHAMNKTVKWSSGNTAVATVDDGGKVTAVSVGTAVITVTTTEGNKQAFCTVTVSATAVPVTGVTLNRTSTSLEVGDTELLTITFNPSNATNQNVTWVSSDPTVATVNGGLVTAVSKGTATITVRTTADAKMAACTVTVTGGNAETVPVSNITLKYTNLFLTAGGSETLIATVAPSNATNQSRTWTSSNPAVAAVDTSGTVTAKAAGTATITVTTADGNKTATCTVTVTAGDLVTVPVTGVSLNKPSTSISPGNTETLTATVAPGNATNKTVTWTSSNPAVATVIGGVVTAVSSGTATITVTTEDGKKTATCTVIVTGGGGISVILNSVTSNGSSTQTTTQLNLTFNAAITGLSAGDITLSGVSGVTPGTLGGTGPTYTLPISGFTSGGTLNVAVAKSGYTIIGSPYKVTIYVASTVTGVTVSPPSPSVAKGTTQLFNATVTGTNNPAQSVSWTINETGISSGTSISSSGLLTVSAAETLTSLTVRATSTQDPGKYADATVTITTPAPAPTYGITLSQSGTYLFTAANQNAAAPAALSVNVTNSGNQATGTLTVALSATSPSNNFTLSTTSVGTIAAGTTSTGAFTVTPTSTATAGTYTATVTVSGGNGISAAFTVSFTVNAATGSTGSINISFNIPDEGIITITAVPGTLSKSSASQSLSASGTTGTISWRVSGPSGTPKTYTGSPISLDVSDSYYTSGESYSLTVAVTISGKTYNSPTAWFKVTD